MCVLYPNIFWTNEEILIKLCINIIPFSATPLYFVTPCHYYTNIVAKQTAKVEVTLGLFNVEDHKLYMEK
jgi:hypothetical protein